MGASILSVREYANQEGITICTAYRRVWQGQVPAEQILGRWFITPPEKKEKSEPAAQPARLVALAPTEPVGAEPERRHEGASR